MDKLIRTHGCLALDDDCFTCINTGEHCPYRIKGDCPRYKVDVEVREIREKERIARYVDDG